MRALCDANVLLALIVEHHAHHQPAIRWFGGQADTSICLCRITQLATLRLLTNSVVMGEDVCSQNEAWKVWDYLVQDTRFVFAQEPAGLEAALRLATKSDMPQTKLWTEAYLAAFSRTAALQLVTFDKDFRRFKGLDLLMLS